MQMKTADSIVSEKRSNVLAFPARIVAALPMAA